MPCCAVAGSFRVLDALYGELGAAGLSEEVVVSSCGCLGLCDSGPAMIVYPEGIWYTKLSPGDVKEIVTSHFAGGRPVERLARRDYPIMRQEILDHRKKYFAMLDGKDRAGILPDDLNDMIRAFMPSRVLLSALELDVFTAVGDGCACGELAGRLKADERALEMLLNALVSLGVLTKDGSIYRNPEQSARFFAEGTRDSARHAQLHVAGMWRRWSGLTECVRTGLPADGARDESSVKSFIAAMDHSARSRARTIVQAVGVDGTRRMLDLGGGSGAYSIAFANAAPDLTSEIIDLPDVVPIAQEHIHRAGLSHRIRTDPGDMLTAPIMPGSYDLVLLSSICHMFSPEENRTLFSRAFEALASKGKLVVADFILDPDKTSPRSAALFALNMLVATPAGATYSEPEYDGWLKAAGFADTKRIRIPGPVNLIVGTRE